MSIYTVADIIAKQSLGPSPAVERVAIEFNGRSMTYGQLEHRAERLATALTGAGFTKGDRVCVLMHNRTEWFEILFALARVGGVLVPVNHLLAPPEISHIIDDSGAKWLMSDELLWDKITSLRALRSDDLTYVAVGVDCPWAVAYESLFDAASPGARPEVGIHDLLLLQYTSGTTGHPKGAMHTHSSVMWNAISQRQHFGIDSSTVYLCLPALSWVAGFHSLLLETLWSGGTAVVNPTTLSFDAGRFCDTVERHRVTHVALVPTVIRRLLELDNLEQHNLSSLRIAITGGEPVLVELLEEMNRRVPGLSLIQVYGMSEFPSLVTLLEPEDAVAKRGSAGRANCVSQVRVVNRGSDCEPGEVGEILTRSPATMLGYFGHPEETEAALAGGWLHTGDLGYLDEDGYLFISGRSKDVIISGGLNIYPAEIEQALLRHPAVAEAAVFGRPDATWGECVVAVIVVRPDTEATDRDLRAFLESEIARFKIPKAWEIRSGPPLPRTASGKVQKYKLA